MEVEERESQGNDCPLIEAKFPILNSFSMNFSDICRVCRCEGSSERPLFHPCICTGSIKYIHQECLLQWLRYSKKGILRALQPQILLYAQ